MVETLSLTSEKFYHQAKKMLEEKDFVDFIANISKAELLAAGDEEIISKVSFLKVQGLFKFNQYKKALESISDALKYNSGEDVLRLKNYQGVILGFLGELPKARRIFEEIQGQVQDIELRVEIYLNIVWVSWTIGKIDSGHNHLEEVKKYLDLANGYFDAVKPRAKGKILDSLSAYYCTIGNYAEAIELEEKALEYFEEQDLPKIYNNLAAMYLEFDKKEGFKSIKAYEYMQKAEKLGEKYKNKLEVAKAFYNQAMAQLQEDQLFAALDTLYLSFEYFKEAEALTLAFDCLVKINQIVNDYKIDRLRSLKDTLKEDLKGTSLFNNIL